MLVAPMGLGRKNPPATNAIQPLSQVPSHCESPFDFGGICGVNVQISCWPGPKTLQIFDAEMGTAIRESTTNPLLARSWDEAIDCEKFHRGVAWWKEKLMLRADNSQDAKIGKGLPANDGCDKTKSDRKLCGSRKRKGTPDFKFPPGYARVEADDDEGGNLFLPLAKDVTGPKIKNEFSDAVSAEIDALYENPDPTYLRRPESNKRRNLGVEGHFSVPPHGRGRDGTPMALDKSGLTKSQATKTLLDPRSTPFLLATDAE